MKFGIIDDELHCLKSLEYDLQKLYPDDEIVLSTTNPKEGLGFLRTQPVDLLFLDIEMPGLTGLELIQELGEFPFEIIFTTAYSDYALAAFKANAINFLLKPIAHEDLQEAVNAWRNPKKSRQPQDRYTHLLEQFRRDGMLKIKIGLPVREGIQFIEVNQIAYCKSQSNYTEIYFSEGDSLLVTKTLRELEALLRDYHFIRPSRSYLVNPNFIKRFVRNDGGYIVMSDLKQISVSPDKKEMISKLFLAIERNYS